MCYIDIDDKLMVNRKFARITNPTVALYWAELQEILKQVRLKGKFDSETGMFKLDRKYVYSETGIETDEQKQADKVLAKLGIVSGIDPNNADRLAINSKKYYEILADDSKLPEEFLSKAMKQTKAERQSSKVAGIKARIVGLFGETDEAVIKAITDLVDVYYDKGYCKNASWLPVINILKIAAPEPDAKVELINFILATNWQSIDAAIDKFMQQHKSTGTRINSEQKKCDNVSDITF